MTDFESQVLQQLSVLKMQMEQLLGNGQPGRLRELELRVESHERGMQRLKGLAGAFGGQGSQTAFGPRAAANVLTRLTTWSAIIFMITSISLTALYVRTSSGSHSVLSGSKAAPVSAPAKSGK